MKRARSEESEQQEVKRVKLATNNETVKVLVVGDVMGNFKSVFTKVAQIDKQHGPFSVLFCVGCFFGTETALTEDDENFLTGDETIPIPTYFIDAKSNSELVSKYLSDGEEGKQLTENV